MDGEERWPGLAGKVAFITGVARGQGRSHAIALAKAGVSIVGIDICAQIPTIPWPMSSPEDLDETVQLVKEAGGRILATQADVRDIRAVRAAVADGVAEFGRLDIVLPNAGVVGVRRPDGLTKEQADAEFEEARRDIIGVNQDGVFNTVQATKDALIDGRSGGSIVITSSLAALKQLGAGPGYIESKVAINGLMRSTANELAPHFIRCNSVLPTNVLTPFIDNAFWAKKARPDLENPTFEMAAAEYQKINLLPIPYIEVSDVTNAVMFLVSDLARYITGVALPIDAGASIR